MADNAEDFHKMADPIYAQANATTCRVRAYECSALRYYSATDYNMPCIVLYSHRRWSGLHGLLRSDAQVPLTDLFDTVSATCAYGKKAFVARPVVGGVFAKVLAPGPYPF